MGISSEHFFTQSHRQPPKIDPAHWSFMLGGLVEIPLCLSYDDLRALPAVELPCTVACSAGGSYIGHAVWQGVSLQTLLDEVQVRDSARFASFHAADGYTTFIEFKRLPGSLLAYGMNDEPLTREHGSPVRLIVPGLYGYKMPKWVQRIALVETPVNGLWEARGWSRSGVVQTTAAIFSPRHKKPVSGPVPLSGIAYAGERSIIRIEISIDDGPWMPVPFTPGPLYSWTHWSITWPPPAPGAYAIKVRASDSAGSSTALHTITVQVTA